MRRSDSPELRLRLWSVSAFTLFGMLGFTFGTWLSRIPSVRDRLDASTLEMSYYGLALALGSLVGLIFSGRVVSKLGALRTIAIGAPLQAAAMITAMALFWMGLVVAGTGMLVVFGFAFGTCDVATNINGASAERAIRRPRMPLFHAAFSLGGVLAMGIGSAAESIRFPVPAHVAIALVTMVAIVLLALRLGPKDDGVARSAVEREPGTSEKAEGEPVCTVPAGPVLAGTAPTVPAAPTAPTAPNSGRRRRGYNPWHDPRIYLLGIIALSMSLGEGTGSDWIALAVVDGHGLSNSAGTLMVGVFLASMLTARVLGSPLLTRFGRVPVIRCSAVVCAVGVAILILVPGSWAPVLGVACWGLGCGLGFPVAISAAADDPDTAVKSVAAVAAIAYGAFLLGPVMIGFLGEHFGLLDAFWPLVGFMAASVVIAGALRERDADPERSPRSPAAERG